MSDEAISDLDERRGDLAISDLMSDDEATRRRAALGVGYLAWMSLNKRLMLCDLFVFRLDMGLVAKR
ncbi:hypothetical protein SO802_022735 [Lithocarpus litseifolius]|uniref:Uncharacterized protein n=1 Tax=Lithocarpus litseifolius TaxID=425828 RepID=A0AAW2C6L5_9ROSI